MSRNNPLQFASSLIEKLRQFLLFLLPMLLILFVAGSIHFYSDYEVRRNSIESSEHLNIQLAKKMVTNDISRIVSDLLFLAEHINHASPNAENRSKMITDLFRTFAKNKGIYDQLRYIDQDGMEQIRINYTGGHASIVPIGALQDKSERYYVKQGLQLEVGNVYLSPMDLNIESGEIEIPHKPVIRFVTPIKSQSGNHNGIIVLNYLGSELIQNFRRAVASISKRVHLVNSDGYWLSHVNPMREWGFMFNNHSIFQKEFGTEWEKMNQVRNGQFVTANGLFSYASINPLQVAQLRSGAAAHVTTTLPNQYSWRVIAHLPTTELESTPIGFFKQNRSLYIAILLFIFILSWILTHNSLRRKTFELQRANELRFRDTLEEIHLAALTIAPSGEILFCNNYLLHLLRKRRIDVIGKNWFEHFVPQEEEQESLRQLLSGESESSSSTYHESGIVDFRGERRLIAWTSTTALNDHQQVESVTCIGQDITEQHKTREELTKLARAAEQSPAVIMITDLIGGIEYINPKFTDLTGYSLEEVLGRNPRILKSGETSQEEYRKLWQTIGSGNEWRGILHNRKKNGDLYWESALISPIRNEEGKITHFLSVKEDITARKQLEEEVQSRQTELDQARTLAVVGRMASMVAHDLRNPLSSIKMGLQILSKKKDEDPEEMELHQIGLEQIRYMESILEGLLAYSRPDDLDLSWSSLDKLIETAISAIQNQVAEHNIEIITHYPSTLPTIEVDKTKMRRVLTNLLTNAAHAIHEAAPKEPKITINARMDLDEGGPRIQLEICDNGTGIDLTERDSLFEPFVTTRAKGTGLGLAIVKRIIEQHHGNIVLQPTPSAEQESGGKENHSHRGTCVIITLPTFHTEPAPSPVDSLKNTPETFIQTTTSPTE